VKDHTRANLEAWFRYHSDLGMEPFFRNRAPAASREFSAQMAAKGPRPPGTSTKPEIARDVSLPPRAASRPRAGTSATPAAAESAARAVTVSAASATSLFDILDRVPGDTLAKIREDIGDCTRCRLHQKRTHIVFGDGHPRAQLVFVGEGPGHDEDLQGLPFVGRAGKLLTQMIEAMGLQRGDVYICNVVKCRPPENRAPEKDEMAICSPFLLRQIDVIQPRAVVCLGAIAVQALLGAGQSISRTRGQWFDFRGARLMPTYHPAYLLRNPAAKPEVWKDLQKVMAFLGLQPKKPSR
jgi:uracil-DNA glycosylase